MICNLCGHPITLDQAYFDTPLSDAHAECGEKHYAELRERVEAETIAKVVAWLVARASSVEGEGEYELVALIDAASAIEQEKWRK